ncbi:hypothetical protein, partial [Clostridium sp. N3C]|uniref:hypothetical protein n=1 Tax=Clostridium sp. N3C TaxID=1776758 RepID=UPI001A9A6131
YIIYEGQQKKYENIAYYYEQLLTFTSKLSFINSLQPFIYIKQKWPKATSAVKILIQILIEKTLYFIYKV